MTDKMQKLTQERERAKSAVILSCDRMRRFIALDAPSIVVNNELKLLRKRVGDYVKLTKKLDKMK